MKRHKADMSTELESFAGVAALRRGRAPPPQAGDRLLGRLLQMARIGISLWLACRSRSR